MNALLGSTLGEIESKRMWMSGVARAAVGMLALVSVEWAAADALMPSGEDGEPRKAA